MSKSTSRDLHGSLRHAGDGGQIHFQSAGPSSAQAAQIDVGGGPATGAAEPRQVDVGLGPHIGVFQADVEVELLVQGRHAGCPPLPAATAAAASAPLGLPAA